MRAVPDAQRMLPGRRAALALAGAVVAVALGGCGASTNSSGSIMIAGNEPPQIRRGAVLFRERCSGCHTFDAAGAQGSKPLGQIGGGERTNGPNFSVRREEREDVLYAIRNGGFSGAIMPANIVVGKEAEQVAEFLSTYSGKQAALAK